MDTFFKVIGEQFEHWIANPVATIFALLVGLAAGFWLGKLRYEGAVDGHKAQIEALKERIINKEDQIKTKDDTIRSLNEDINYLSKATVRGKNVGRRRTVDTAVLSPNVRHYSSETERLEDLLLRTTYKFVFNPKNDASKILSFGPHGQIEQGRNDNERYWRIDKDQLEILNSDGKVYSRFNLLDDGMSWHHTNERDLLSLRGQYMHPISMIPHNPDLRG